MDTSGQAYFVHEPRRIEDLITPHDINVEQDYEIVAAVNLGAMDYQNFITDMCADRQFIEDHYMQCCGTGEPLKCLLVRQHGKRDGVLIVPADRCYIKCAAYYTEA